MKQLLAGLCTLAMAGGVAAQTETHWQELNLALTDEIVIPGYLAFAESTKGLVPAAEAFCASSDQANLQALQERFHQAMDGWQSVQHIQFGPVTYFNWNYRMQYWPDEKGIAPRQLEALVAAGDPAALEADRFARLSVGVQGISALELLLFSGDALQQLQGQPYRCQVVQAIAANLEQISAGIAQRWQEDFRAVISTAGNGELYESTQDATIDFMKALVESVRRVKEQKLDAVTGSSFATLRTRKAESWRSERSLRNIQMNVAAFAALYRDSSPQISSILQPADHTVVDQAFNELEAQVAALPDSLAEVLATEEGYTRVVALSAALDGVYEALEAALKNTDLYLGFNSLDGD